MVVKIALAKTADANEIVDMHVKLRDYHIKIDKYYRRIDSKLYKKDLNRTKKSIRKRNTRVIIARDDDTVVAYIIGVISPGGMLYSPKKIGWVIIAFVEKKYRSKGIGRMMLNELIKWFKKKGVRHVHLNVATKNVLGVKAWKGLGFKDFQSEMKLDI